MAREPRGRRRRRKGKTTRSWLIIHARLSIPIRTFLDTKKGFRGGAYFLGFYAAVADGRLDLMSYGIIVIIIVLVVDDARAFSFWVRSCSGLHLLPLLFGSVGEKGVQETGIIRCVGRSGNELYDDTPHGFYFGTDVG